MNYNEQSEIVARRLGTVTEKGLNRNEAKKRLKRFGYNKLKEKKKESLFIKFIKQFKDFMIIILIAAAVISAFLSFNEGNSDYIDSIIIIGIVVFNAILGVVQENKAEKSLEALKKLSSPMAKVKRDGIISLVPTEEVVPGDVIVLEAGNYIPADARLISAFNLKVEEAALTGEAEPILKDASVILKENIPTGDMINMVFSTTIITNGHGEAIVTETGMDTKVGKIAHMIISDKSPDTPLQRKLEHVGKMLGITALAICSVIFAIGMVKGIGAYEMFMTAVGLAVAAIPEGLPAIVTIVLSIGVTKMARKNAIIRKLPAVETLGSSSVICSDKTGTLTQNKMEVVELSNLSGTVNPKSTSGKLILEIGSLCNDSNIINEKSKVIVQGDPTEVAIVNCMILNHGTKDTNHKKRVAEIPFDSTRKLMTTIHQDGGKYLIAVKGAPDELIKCCDRYYGSSGVESFTQSMKAKIEYTNRGLSSKALRVLGVAYSESSSAPSNLSSENVERNLIFVGLVGMIDPPRQGVKEAVAVCNGAGIKTVMITGDHILTAKAIAQNLGILKPGDIAITGADLDNIPDHKLTNDIFKYSVFARVSPEHKVRIVKAFRARGEVVAMTGDGVNDAPALKSADIGISMGKTGTDVAKSASDMILTDDNFTTIVEAVKIGRSMYDNIQKAIHFLLATNIGEIVVILLGLLLGFESPLVALQLLWVNLITDSLPAIALGLEPVDKMIMYKKPRDPRKSIFSDGVGVKIVTEGIMIGLLTLLAFFIGNIKYGLEVARTMAFVTLSMSELCHALNMKSEKSILSGKLFNNIYLIGAMILGAVLQIGVTLIPPVATVFKVVPLNNTQWLYVTILSIIPIFIMEFQKMGKKEKVKQTSHSYANR